MKITALIENDSAREGILAQYGLSLLLQTPSGTVLVDAGQNDAALSNFLALGYDPDQIDAIVVSHNHFDHIGGLQSFLDATAAHLPPVYVSAGAGTELYTKRFFTRKRLCSRNDLIGKNRDRIRFVSDSQQILPGVYVCTIPNPDPAFVCKDKKLRMQGKGNRLVPDDFRHEVYVAVMEADGLKVISSCSHSGIVNILRDAARRFGCAPKVFVGGLHMRGKHHDTLNCSRAYVAQVLDTLNTLQLDSIHTCHCTGALGFDLLQKDFRGEAAYFTSGDSFTV